ncbi:MAG: hypothetical protein V1790_15695 [Planctomycetota bacterium]
MWKSAKMYVTLLGKWTWVLVADVGASGLGLADAFGGRVPKLVWVGLLVGGLISASFFAFHKLRMQDEADLKAANGRVDAAETRLAQMLATREYKFNLVQLQADVRALELESVAPLTFDAWKKRFYELLQGACNFFSNSNDPGKASVLLNVPPDNAPVERSYNEEHLRMVRKLRAIRLKLSEMIDAQLTPPTPHTGRHPPSEALSALP